MTDLIDRVAEAMAGWPMDTAPAEDAEAWRANAKAAIGVLREHPDLELRDDLIVLFANRLADLMDADVEVHVSNALVLADALLEQYDVEPLSDSREKVADV